MGPLQTKKQELTLLINDLRDELWDLECDEMDTPIQFMPTEPLTLYFEDGRLVMEDIEMSKLDHQAAKRQWFAAHPERADTFEKEELLKQKIKQAERELKAVNTKLQKQCLEL